MSPTKRHIFLSRLAQTAEWINVAIRDKTLRDRIAFREACELVRHAGRLRRRLLYGSVRAYRGDNFFQSDPRKAKREAKRRRASLGLSP